MGCPTDKPNFRELARNIHTLSETSLTVLLSDMFETGYHIGMIYGGWTEQDKDTLYAERFAHPTDTLQDYMLYAEEGGSEDD